MEAPFVLEEVEDEGYGGTKKWKKGQKKIKKMGIFHKKDASGGYVEEVELTELLKSKDKSVIDAFYKENSLVGRLLSTDGKSLEKHGMGGQTIAAWLKDKIAITAVSDVKSTEVILRYMKNTIPKGNFDPKSYKKFFEEVEATRMPMEAPVVLVDGVTGPTRMEIQKFFDKEKGLLRVRINNTEKAFKISNMKVDARGNVVSYGDESTRRQEIKSKIIDDSYHGTFAGNDVFIVDSDTFHTCRLGKQKYHRYEKYVGNGKIGQAIREFGLTNPKKPIILQNGEGGPMLYLRYGGSKRYA